MSEKIKQICQECKESTRIQYHYNDSFFNPRLKGINHLEVGYSKIISNPFTIILEFFYVILKKVRNGFESLSNYLFPRRDKIYFTKANSYLTGKVIHADRSEQNIPIHNLKIEFWARTHWLAWRKLGESYSDKKGDFTLTFTLREARNWKISMLFAEIHQPFKIVYKGSDPTTVFRLYRSIPIDKSDLIGLGYNLRNIPLPLWEYRWNTPIPRTQQPKEKAFAPEVYDKGREDALIQQIIPIELTKQKHLFQIREEPGLISHQDIQADYPENLTVCIEKKLKGYTRSDEWFGERFMNGMNKSSFIPFENDPDFYQVKLFGICHYDHNKEYALPDVDITFKYSPSSAPMPVAITFTGQINAYNKDPWQKSSYTPASGENWAHAKRLARVVGAVVAEVDDHFAGTHVNTEQYAIAAFRNFRQSPVAWLLYPHLKEVSLINYAADSTIIGGYLPTATALTEKGMNERVYDILGFQNWKGWEPMKVINESHSFAKAENLFWQITGDFIDFYFEKYKEEIKLHWNEVYSFSRDLVDHSVPVFLSTLDEDSLTPDEKSRNEERFRYGCCHYSFDPKYSTEIVNGEIKVISPITKSEEFELEEDMNNLKQTCRYAIMMATFSHTWINEHQYDDLGEIFYNCGGLRFGSKKEGVMAPESDLEIAPDLTRSTQMLWFTNLLSRTEYGFLTDNTENDIHPYFIQLLKENREKFNELGVDIDAIESRTNI